MLTTSPLGTAAAHAHHGITLPNLRAALMKAADYAMALHYRYVRARIEAELRGPAGRMLRARDFDL